MNKIVWSTVVQLLGKGVQILLGVLSIKLITNVLGPDEYGLYGKISEYALFFSVAANLGIFGNTVRKMSEHPRDGKLFVNALVLRMVTALTFFVVGAIGAWIWIPDASFTMGVVFFMASLFLDYVSSVCDGMLQANYKMGRATLALLMGRAANFGLLILLIKVGTSASAPLFFLAPLLGAAVTTSISLIFVSKLIHLEWRLDLTIMKMIFLTALPFGIINIINNLYFRFLPSFFAAKALSDAQYGSYNVSLHIAATASLLSTLIMFSSLPTLKQAIEHKQRAKTRDLFNTLKRSLLTLGMLMILGGSFVAPYAIQLMSGKTFVIPQLWFILPMLLILAAISYFYDLVLITLFAFEKDAWLLKREGLALLVGLSLLLISTFIPGLELKILFILGSAIAAESTTTVLGLRKIQRLL